MNSNNVSPKQQHLISAWESIYQGAGKALEWIAEVRDSAPKINNEADAFNLKLYRARNLANSLKRVSATPMTVGFFGLSQAGKSYLISALAADNQGQLETDIGNQQRLNFIDHFNPIGSGKEATGLVTRFTYQQQPLLDSQYPLQLRLFNEIEIAIILANAWFEDFDQEAVEFEISETLIQQTLAPYIERTLSQTVPGITAEDTVALADYLRLNYRSSTSKLDMHYWPSLIRLAPYLSIAERAQVFSILWGQQKLLTDTYIQLASALHQLDLAKVIYAPISAIVQPRGDAWVQTNSIMNVDTLSLLMTARDLPLQVRPLTATGELGTPTTILTAQLTALTTEVVFPLANPPKDKIVEQVDLLDFPGYRTRQKLLKIEDALESEGDDSSPVSKLLLRGKVAYLFERYTTLQEMNALVMCTSSFKQSEVVTVGPVISQWINNTQGATPEQRANRCGLIWALTMMDGFIAQALNLKPEQYPEHCENMLKLTMMERFGNLNWMKEWAPNQPFNNTFLVRKPRLQTPFIELDAENHEIALLGQTQDKLSQLGQTFSATPAVLQHVATPQAAWDAMLTLNDGGISRFSHSFNEIANLDFKLDRIKQQLEQCQTSLLQDLERWYQAGGEEALSEKRKIASMLYSHLRNNSASKKQGHPAIIGELLHYLKVPDEQLRNLYLSGVYEQNDSVEETSEETEIIDLFNSNDDDYVDLFSTDPTPAAPAQPVISTNLNSHESRFAKAAFSLWVSHLRSLSERTELAKLLTLDPRVISALADEIISASYRYKLEEKIAQALLAHAKTGLRREQTVNKQLLNTQMIFQDYTAWLGNLDLSSEQRAKRMLNLPGNVFDFYDTQGPADLPNLPEQVIEQEKPGYEYINDWLFTIADITINNAGHTEGREITPEQNSALGFVINCIKVS